MTDIDGEDQIPIRSWRGLRAITFGLSLVVAGPINAMEGCESRSCAASWLNVDAPTRGRIFDLAEDYKKFMTIARTELSTVEEVKRRALAQGFREWQPSMPLKPGNRYFVDNRGRSIALFVVGSQPIANGLRISASHVDSPRLELKARPLYEREGFALFQTDYHGNIINYQWGNVPLALLGKVYRKNGSAIDISVGLNPGDPVFIIPTLSQHVDIDLRGRTQRDVLQAEELDPVVASTPSSESEGPIEWVRRYLSSTYGMTADDFVSAELALVPATSPRDVGFDRALMAIYGQDDRFSAYAATRAIFDIRTPLQTSLVYLADNEEAGNFNNTGAGSNFLPDLIGELVFAAGDRSDGTPQLARTLRKSRALSSDVNDGVNPIWPDAWEPQNAARLGHGINFKMYGKGIGPNAEYTAWVRRIFDEAGIPWQTATYKVGRARGGTLGVELSKLNMEVIDIGAPVLSIHSTYDLSSKIDLWWLYQAHRAFFAYGKE